MRSGRTRALLFLLAACEEAPQQFFVELELEEPLAQALSVVQLDALDRDGEIIGKSQRLSVTGPELADRVVTFGAVPGPDGHLTLRARGLDGAGAIVLEQTQESELGPQRKTHMVMRLLASCLGKSACTGEPAPCGPSAVDATQSCDGGAPDSATLPDADTQPDACLLGTILDCGQCGLRCSTANVKGPTCEMGQCAATCQEHFGDCDENLTSNGCETDLLKNPKHCNGCNVVCPYGVCIEGRCERECEGWPTYVTGSNQGTVPPNRMFGVQIRVLQEGVLAGLGVNLQRGRELTNSRFRMALYASNSSGQPDFRIDETAETWVHALGEQQSSALNDCGSPHGLEMETPNHQRLSPGLYWFFLISSGDLIYDAKEIEVPTLRSQNDVSYASLLHMPPLAGGPSPLLTIKGRLPAVYLIRTPIR